MNKITNTFLNKKAFIGYITGTDGGHDYNIECAHQLVQGGINILEVGLPFSDPVADGPVIQRASKRALEHGATGASVLDIAKGIRQNSDVPLVLFSYFNPLLKLGRTYLKSLKTAGYDAVLVVDLPPPITQDTCHPYYTDLKMAGLHPIFIVSPSTSEERLSSIVELSEGFIYYACQKGTTGARNTLPDDFAHNIAKIRKKSMLPIAAGFGIADRNIAGAVVEHADGFVVGSAFVELMEAKVDPRHLKQKAQEIDPRDKG